MITSRLLPLAAALLLSAAGVAAAQEPSVPGPSIIPAGTRVRITTPFVEREIATLVTLRPDSFVAIPVRHPSDTLAILAAHLRLLEVSQGRKRATWHDAGVGTLVGGIIGSQRTRERWKRVDVPAP